MVASELQPSGASWKSGELSPGKTHFTLQKNKFVQKILNFFHKLMKLCHRYFLFLLVSFIVGCWFSKDGPPLLWHHLIQGHPCHN
jgi:hypothetical protein